MTHSRLKMLLLHLGGEQKLEEILIDFYQRMSQDLLIGFFFSNQNIHAIALKQRDFMLLAMGVRPSSTGKAPKEAHQLLPPIRKGHFDRRLVILKEVLISHGVPPEDIRIWIDFESAFRPVIEQH